jgi:hypothetical protein
MQWIKVRASILVVHSNNSIPHSSVLTRYAARVEKMISLPSRFQLLTQLKTLLADIKKNTNPPINTGPAGGM